MATTSSRGSGGLSAQAASGPPSAQRRRNLPLVVSGLLLVVGCAVAFAVMSANAGDRRSVLVVLRDVPAGTVLTRDHVGTVRAAAPASLHLLTEAELEVVIGRATSVPLSARTLLTREALARRAFPPPGQAVLGVALEAGRVPPGLVPGLRVRAYWVAGDQSGQQAAEQSAGAGGEPALPITLATVLTVRQVRDGGATVVEIQLPEDDVPQVAAAAAAGRVTLALVAGR